MSFNFNSIENNSDNNDRSIDNKINKKNDLDASHVLHLALQQMDGIIASKYKLND